MCLCVVLVVTIFWVRGYRHFFFCIYPLISSAKSVLYVLNIIYLLKLSPESVQ